MNGYNNWEYNNFRPRQRRGPKIFTYICLMLITSLVTSAAVGGALYSKFSGELEEVRNTASASASGVTKVSNPSGNIALNDVLSQGSSVTSIAKKASPSIVGIRTTVASQSSRFYDIPSSSGEGSGVIISEDGYIMTNYHVVSNADPKSGISNRTTLEVFLHDKRQVEAEFIGGDSQNDLAVIKINLDDITPAELGDSSKLQVGELAVAIGNPLGIEFMGSVTSGIVSAMNRTVTIGDNTLTLIQTDAAINPGNSGGALLNSQGKVIGINTAKISVSGVEGLGFAIPINIAKPIVDQLIMFGYVKGRPMIGIGGNEITEVFSQIYNIPIGIYITEVSRGSGAYNAGLKKGDVLVSLAGKEVKTMKDVDTIKKKYKAGDTVDIVIVRDGKKQNLKLTFSEEK
ncbi:serine protease Do [Anaerobacterium chartisolvens]|uniref:Serine protease Do n=1 Tax=Anaerobacterium chartisolvens TaxID=1297424 RepID=A0A369AJS9_9FIRM|nr:trypsin-like peptidase domain-containing protein [Anaerobacterium chartisolvens]RCX09620.1 serine protease Do [Anaerobacterium chartisolvens]